MDQLTTTAECHTYDISCYVKRHTSESSSGVKWLNLMLVLVLIVLLLKYLASQVVEILDLHSDENDKDD